MKFWTQVYQHLPTGEIFAVRSQFQYFFYALRPLQWIKNLLVFAAIIFSGNLTNLTDIISSCLTFVLFCMAASSIYLINDLIDRKQDAVHPEKRHRPIAAGRLNHKLALIGALGLMVGAIVGGFQINVELGFVIVGYIAMICLYSIKLKQIVIADIIIVALGFVLRAIAGGFAIGLQVSSWLLVCTLFLALFLVIGKRRHEILVLQNEASNHRRILVDYSPQLLDQMMAIVTSATLVAYALYTRDQQTIERFQTSNLIYTIPFVIYGIFRYLYLIYKLNEGGRPEKILINDPGILFALLGWIITVGFILY